MSLLSSRAEPANLNICGSSQLKLKPAWYAVQYTQYVCVCDVRISSILVSDVHMYSILMCDIHIFIALMSVVHI